MKHTCVCRDSGRLQSRSKFENVAPHTDKTHIKRHTRSGSLERVEQIKDFVTHPQPTFIIHSPFFFFYPCSFACPISSLCCKIPTVARVKITYDVNDER